MNPSDIKAQKTMGYYVDNLTAIRDKTNSMIVRILPINCSKRETAKLTILLCKAMNDSEKGNPQ